MNILDGMRTVRPARDLRIEREPVRNDEVDEARDAEDRARAQRARFAKVLELLANSGDAARARILEQVPADGATLLDRLLNGAAPDGAQGTDMSASDPAAAMRYGMLNSKESSTGGHASDRANELRGLQGITRAAQNGGNSEALARLATRRGTSLEELLALGDTKTAELKAALDALLSGATGSNANENGGTGAAGGNDVATAAHVAALEAARARSAADVTTPVNDTEALSPDFRARLDRVIERMKTEYDHDVQVVETARSQERQDHLFEQGRSRSGPVVTWTRDSAHLSGHAADVVVDDKWNNAEGYARLQRIAREEGLRTLGMRDPGHLELPKDARTISANQQSSATDSNATGNTASASGIARVASLAQVATVARVSTTANSAPPASASAFAHASSNSALLRQESNGNSASGNGGNGNDRRSSERNARGTSVDDIALPPIGARGDNNGQANHGAAATEKAAAPAGAAAFDRVMEAQRLRDNAPARTLTELTLEVEGANGGKDQVTIGMRGNTVGAHIVTDAENAERLRSRTGELQEALGRHGLDTDTVRISNSRPEGAAAAKGFATAVDRDAIRLTGAQQSSNGDGGMQQQQRERSTSAREQQARQDERRERDQQREASAERERRGPFNPHSK